MNPHVVIHDPKGEYAEGHVLTDARVNEQRGKGVVLLPVNLQLLKVSGCGGYVKRSFGSGWKFDPLRAARGPALFMLVTPEQDVHWTARLQQVDGEAPQGNMRIVPDSAQPGASVVGLHGMEAISLNNLGEPDENGGWTISGRFGLTAAGVCYIGLMLYGTAAGVRVTWLAAGQPG